MKTAKRQDVGKDNRLLSEHAQKNSNPRQQKLHEEDVWQKI